VSTFGETKNWIGVSETPKLKWLGSISTIAEVIAFFRHHKSSVRLSLGRSAKNEAAASQCELERVFAGGIAGGGVDHLHADRD
jgi:hypothetical protein